MTYRGYTAAVTFDADDHVFTGRVLDLRDVIYFEGTTVGEIEAAMRAAVDDYLALCDAKGKTPDRPYSGRVGLRLPRELHRAAALRAAAEGATLNDLLVDAVRSRVSGREAA